ncbi:CSC1-like protein HYP1 isoform X5 [Vigna angularis]|uniref:CSC1-like protein HYP1 isoform X5 n=1 Tax=Phaseolus angularis TaxID=3914 RepID=UPI0022B4E8FA|nr:CSC1-like protein HYP1 isoform X5 [Vigna angularis]
MILSALLTSVGINLGLCFLFFTLYSVLRRQPGNITVYAPRLVAEGKVKEGGHFNLERLLPTAGWVKQAWEPSEDDFLSSSGLDAFVFMRIFIFSLKVFAVGGVIGMFVLLPINYAGSQLSDDSDFQHKSLDSFSISNVNNGSNRLWVHFSAAYVFTGIVCYLLYYKLYKKLTNLKQKNDAPKRHRRDGCLGICGRKVDIVDHYERRLGDIEDNVRLEQSSLEAKEVQAAFVSFKTRFGAAIASHIQESVNPTEWVTEKAPEPHDVYWPFFTVSFLKRWIGKVVVFVACTSITVLFFIPVAIVQGLTHLDQLETWFPFLKGILRLSVVSQVITGYLPSLILQLFLSFVPPIMIMLSSMQGYISWSQIQKSACTKVLWFTIWNIFFANVLSGSALYRVNVFLEPKEIPRILAEAVPSQASFFIAYVVTSGWTTIASELFQLTTLLSNFMSRTFCRNSDGDFDPPSIPYHSEIPRIRLFGLLGVTYFILAPLILPFLLVYFCMGYIIFRNQHSLIYTTLECKKLSKVYVPKFETGGEFWPTVHNSTIFSLVLMHIIGIGIFGLKKLPLASILTIPLPILTLLFNEYCQKRFFPIFKDYPVECLIKKDRADQNQHNMIEFYDELANAYNDPALMPKKYSERSDSQRSPLLNTS